MEVQHKSEGFTGKIRLRIPGGAESLIPVVSWRFQDVISGDDEVPGEGSEFCDEVGEFCDDGVEFVTRGFNF